MNKTSVLSQSSLSLSLSLSLGISVSPDLRTTNVSDCSREVYFLLTGDFITKGQFYMPYAGALNIVHVPR